MLHCNDEGHYVTIIITVAVKYKHCKGIEHFQPRGFLSPVHRIKYLDLPSLAIIPTM